MAGLFGILFMLVAQLAVPIYLGATGGSYFWLIAVAAVLALIGKDRQKGPIAYHRPPGSSTLPTFGEWLWGFIGSLLILSVIFFIARWLWA